MLFPTLNWTRRTNNNCIECERQEWVNDDHGGYSGSVYSQLGIFIVSSRPGRDTTTPKRVVMLVYLCQRCRYILTLLNKRRRQRTRDRLINAEITPRRNSAGAEFHQAGIPPPCRRNNLRLRFWVKSPVIKFFRGVDERDTRSRGARVSFSGTNDYRPPASLRMLPAVYAILKAVRAEFQQLSETQPEPKDGKQNQLPDVFTFRFAEQQHRRGVAMRW